VKEALFLAGWGNSNFMRPFNSGPRRSGVGDYDDVKNYSHARRMLIVKK
jgi:hypothetical protein